MTFPYDLSIYESLAVLTFKHSLPQSQHKLLSEWLGCYKYIMPADRTLIEGALELPIQKTSSAVFKQYLFTVILETNYTEAEQIDICRYIKCHSHF